MGRVANSSALPQSYGTHYQLTDNGHQGHTQFNDNESTQNARWLRFATEVEEQRSLAVAIGRTNMARTFAALISVVLLISIASCTVWENDGALIRAPGLSLRMAANEDGNRPTQVHLALYDATWKPATRQVGITISWATAQTTSQSIVRYGRSADKMPTSVKATVAPTQYQFCEYNSTWFHHVVIPGEQLEPNTTYFYQCGDPTGGWSEVLTFTTSLAVGDTQPATYAVIGDLGQTEYSKQTIRHLINEPGITAILHAGDLSYADSYQPRWDSWGKLIEPLASTCPWMVAVGNHEEERPCQKQTDRFVAYQQRFRMPYNPTDDAQEKSLYYAFRSGLVHFIILTPYTASDESSPQYKWLQDEFRRVDRTVTPWVVVMMHGPWYNSNTAHQGHEPHVAMKANMEQLFFDNKVDLAISGHVHAYERSYAVYQEKVRPDGTVYVVLGDGGNREGLAPTYIHPKPAWSAFRLANYGFGLFRVANRTHASISMYEDQDAGNARLQDSAWLTTTQYRIATRTTSAVLP